MLVLLKANEKVARMAKQSYRLKRFPQVKKVEKHPLYFLSITFCKTFS
jgi:hypothetical protein